MLRRTTSCKLKIRASKKIVVLFLKARILSLQDGVLSYILLNCLLVQVLFPPVTTLEQSYCAVTSLLCTLKKKKTKFNRALRKELIQLGLPVPVAVDIS